MIIYYYYSIILYSTILLLSSSSSSTISPCVVKEIRLLYSASKLIKILRSRNSKSPAGENFVNFETIFVNSVTRL